MGLQSSINTWFMVITEEFCLRIHDTQQTWSTWVNWCIQVLDIIFLVLEYYLLCRMFHYNEGFPRSHFSQLDPFNLASFCMAILQYISCFVLINRNWRLRQNLHWNEVIIVTMTCKTTPLECFRQPILTEWHKLGK